MQLFLLFALFGLMAGHALGALNTISNPGGGRILFGHVEGQTTEAGAMGAMLRSIHNEFGDRPQVGKLFQVRGTQSVAAFFSVNKRRQGAGQVTGLIIVTKATSDHVEAAMVSDDAARFGSTFNPMMKSLFGAWRPLDAARAGGPGSGATVAPLHRVVLRDRSAAVDLPAGWTVQAASGGGTILADGPNGEGAYLDVTYLAMDTNNPYVRQTQQTVMRGGLRNTSYANALYYPYGGDPAKAFVDLTQMMRSRSRLTPATFQIRGETRVPAPAGQICAHLTGYVDAQDGKGAREMNTVYCVAQPGKFGSYLSFAYYTVVPTGIADRERAMMGAILASFTVDMAVVRREANAISAPVIDQIHAIGRAAAAQADAAHRRNEIQNSSVYQHWDDIDRRSKEFSNYQLGYSVVQDNQNNLHGTLWNQDADELVRRDPQRFEYVGAPNFWKGVDY